MNKVKGNGKLIGITNCNNSSLKNMWKKFSKWKKNRKKKTTLVFLYTCSEPQTLLIKHLSLKCYHGESDGFHLRFLLWAPTSPQDTNQHWGRGREQGQHDAWAAYWTSSWHRRVTREPSFAIQTPKQTLLRAHLHTQFNSYWLNSTLAQCEGTEHCSWASSDFEILEPFTATTKWKSLQENGQATNSTQCLLCSFY